MSPYVRYGFPSSGGEDFGELIRTSRRGGAILLIGAGIGSPGLHNPDYDFPVAIIETDISMYWSIIQKTLEADSN